jgi:HEAT repeats
LFFSSKCLRAASITAAIALFATTLPTPAHADEAKVQFLAEKLNSDDFRVRTNAALALGATGEEIAVDPLCKALADENEVVRKAAVAGIKRLAKPKAIGCVKARIDSESNEGIKAQLEKLVESLAGGGGSSAVPAAGAKYYVALAVNNRTDRPAKEVEDAVVATARKKLEATGTIFVASGKESMEQAKATMAKSKLKGFYLSISVEPFDKSSGTKAIVKVAVFTYPAKNLKAEVPGKAKSGGSDRGTEDAVLVAATETATETFASNLDNF